MQLENEHFRAMIYYDYKSQLSPSQSHQRLQHAFSDSAPSIATVYNWFSEFRRGRGSLKDEERNGRPADLVTPDLVSRTQAIVTSNPHITYKQLEGILHISSGTVKSILHEQLHLRKLTCRWVPHLLTDAQKDARVKWCRFMLEKFSGGDSRQIANIYTGDETWIYAYDPERKQQSMQWVFPNGVAPTKCRRSRSGAKVMICTFFCRSGHLVTVPLEEQRTVNAEWYVSVCLPKVLRSIQEKRPKTGLRGIFLHQDNASAHIAQKTTQYFETNKVNLLSHPPYSPDLAPCDYFLFPKIKAALKGKIFQDAEEALQAFLEELEMLDQSDFVMCFHMWCHRMNRCIQCSGDYFEKM